MSKEEKEKITRETIYLGKDWIFTVILLPIIMPIFILIRFAETIGFLRKWLK